ncbi:MAG: ParA family protein [Nitrospiraceae bacterium]|nr:MAG: ParA family protein [Nitrospiraceae bacterium]
MRQVISVVNLKGGVGKTTSAVNIAACWGEIGKKVLLIDLDPQGSASLSVGITNDGNELLQALQNSTALPVVSTDVPGVDLVPSGIALASAGQWISGNESSSILNPCLDQTDGIWDYIIIDCPPSLGVFTNNALVSSQHVFVPVEASFLGLNGLKQMVTAIDNIKSTNASLRIEAVIPCRAHRRRRIHWDIMDKLKEMFPGRISPVIRENVSLAEAPGLGKPVILSSRLSKGADDYRLVTLWLDERMNRNESTAHKGFTGLQLYQTYN